MGWIYGGQSGDDMRVVQLDESYLPKNGSRVITLPEMAEGQDGWDIVYAPRPFGDAQNDNAFVVQPFWDRQLHRALIWISEKAESLRLWANNRAYRIRLRPVDGVMYSCSVKLIATPKDH